MIRVLGITVINGKIRCALSSITKGKSSILKIREGEIKSTSSEKILKEIRNFIKREKLKANEVSFGIPEEEVIIKIGSYPKMPKEELRKIVLDEISSYKVFENDYPVLNMVKLLEKDGRERYLIVSILRKKALKWIDIIKRAGLNLKRIELNPIGSFRAIKLLNREKVVGSGVFVFINNSKTTLMFYRNGDILFLREFEIGYEEIEEKFDSWINELTNTISYYSREEGETIEKIIISGIEGGLEKISNELSERLNIPVEFGTPIPKTSYTISTPIGLSLFKIDERISINLIPKDIIEKPKDELKSFFSGLFIAILGILILSLSMYLITSQRVTDSAIKETKNNLKRIEKSLEDLKGVEIEYSKASKELNRLKSITEGLKSKKVSQYLSKIYSLREGVIVLNTNVSGENIGLSLSGNSFQEIFSYRKRLLQTELFSKVNILRIEKKEGGGVVCQMSVQGVEEND